MRRWDLVPDTITFSALIGACARRGLWEFACVFLERMLKECVQPNVVSFSSAIDACDKGGAWEKALWIIMVMHSQEVEPNLVSWHAAINSCRSSALWQTTLQLIGGLHRQSLRPNAIGHIAAIVCCAFSMQPSHMVSLLQGLAPTWIQLTSRDVSNLDAFSHPLVSHCERLSHGIASAALDRFVNRVVQWPAIQVLGILTARTADARHQSAQASHLQSQSLRNFSSARDVLVRDACSLLGLADSDGNLVLRFSLVEYAASQADGASSKPWVPSVAQLRVVFAYRLAGRRHWSLTCAEEMECFGFDYSQAQRERRQT